MRPVHSRLYISIFTLLCFYATANAALAAGGIESEFQAFKQKLAKAQGAIVSDSKTSEKSPAAAGSPLSNASASASSSAGSPLNNAASSPLGPAGSLPLHKMQPLTSSAMGSGSSGSYAAPLTPDPISQEEIQAKAEEDMVKQKEKNDKADYCDALKELLPLKPEQIREMLDAFKVSRQAAEEPIALPVPKIKVQTVSLDPSWDPPLIKTAPGYVTTITFLDSTGAPWAIQDIGWAGKFEVSGPEEGGHVVRVVPQTAHGIGNLSVRLVDLITPVTFSLKSGLDEVYYRFDARIPKAGPLAKAPLIEYGGLNTVTGEDENLVHFLDGTPPEESEKLKIEGVDERTKVWRSQGSIYLRTPLTLLSPSWDSSVTSADGMNVYTLSDASVILLSDNGRMVKAHIVSDGGTQ